MTSLSMRDAAVALRSLPRRFGEVLNGPVGDDAWDRLVRTVGSNGQSAVGWVVRTTAAVTSLGTAVAALPLQARPSVSLADALAATPEARVGSAKAALAELKEVAERAAKAIEGRQPDDFDRVCLVDGKELATHSLVETVVATGVANLKHAQESLTEAQER